MKRRSLSILLILVGPALLCMQPLFAQKKKVELVQADRMSFDKSTNDARVVTGNVIFKHDSALLYCDSSLFNEQNNYVEAYGNVRIQANDSMNIYGDELFYDGKTRIALLKGNVRLIDNTTTLLTPSLTYNRNTRIASYDEGGVITDRQNELTSERGRYYTPDKQFYFRDSVKLHNEKYDMFSDTLHYNTDTELAEFFGYTEIISEENTIICREGWYNTKTDLSSFSRRAHIIMEGQVLFGDSVFYNRNMSIGEAFRDILLIDTTRDMVIKGNYAIYREVSGNAMVTDSALAIIAEEEDSLYLHGDTLWAILDSNGTTEELYCYHKVKFFRSDMQGLADSLSYIMADSMIWMLGDPVLWSGAYQMLADSIRVELANDEIDKVYFIENAFIAALDDTNAYNQLKGQNMTGYFLENEMVKMEIFGNAETLYHVRDEDGSLTGINKAVSSDITLRFKDKKIKEIVYYREPEAVLYPPSKYPGQDRQLEGFYWQGNRRPKQASDVFNW